jgi:hypothetical protein
MEFWRTTAPYTGTKPETADTAKGTPTATAPALDPTFAYGPALALAITRTRDEPQNRPHNWCLMWPIPRQK